MIVKYYEDFSNAVVIRIRERSTATIYYGVVDNDPHVLNFLLDSQLGKIFNHLMPYHETIRKL